MIRVWTNMIRGPIMIRGLLHDKVFYHDKCLFMMRVPTTIRVLFIIRLISMMRVDFHGASDAPMTKYAVDGSCTHISFGRCSSLSYYGNRR